MIWSQNRDKSSLPWTLFNMYAYMVTIIVSKCMSANQKKNYLKSSFLSNIILQFFFNDSFLRNFLGESKSFNWKKIWDICAHLNFVIDFRNGIVKIWRRNSSNLFHVIKNWFFPPFFTLSILSILPLSLFLIIKLLSSIM